MPHTLLLADDSVTIQRVIELTFADEDIHVIAVGDGKQAIERIQSDRPDIVLADIGMPERDGYEVAAFVKGHPDLAHVPVLLLTGAFEPIDEGRARAAGCDGVLVKPFEPQMVINRVKDLLAGRHPAGLWAAATLSQPAQHAKPAPAPPDFDLRTTAPPPAGQAAGGSLEDYFDRLDAAFAELDSSGAAPGGQAGPAHVPKVPAPSNAQPAAQTPASTAAAVSEPPPAPALPPLSLPEAFAALLSAEQGQPIAPAAVRPEDIPDATIEEIVRRVIDRMGTTAVKQTVLDVAERMVREEIARIKRGS